MSTSETPAGSSWQQAGLYWNYLAPYAGPPIAASAAIVPAYPLLAIKSFQQLGQPVPRMTLKEAILGGLRIAPTTGSIVGSQMVIQFLLEKALGRTSGDAPQSQTNYMNMLLSSMATGALSAPILAGFNGQTMGRTFWQSARSLTAPQAGAIVAQESVFVFSMRASDPVSRYMQETFGNNPFVGYASAYLTGATGSLCNHFANTALTRWQNGLKVENLGQLMKGSPARAIALGGFAALYKLGKELLVPTPSDSAKPTGK